MDTTEKMFEMEVLVILHVNTQLTCKVFSCGWMLTCQHGTFFAFL